MEHLMLGTEQEHTSVIVKLARFLQNMPKTKTPHFSRDNLATSIKDKMV